MRNIKVVDFTYGRRSSDDVNTSLPFTDNYKETKTIQQANAVISAYINENIKDIAEVNSNLDDLVVEVESKQNELISGENIKTINGETILGSGDISVVSDVIWGDITGDIVDQTDLQNALADKQNELISGENIKTINNESILGDGNIDVQSTITGSATTITGNNLTANRTLISDSNGKVAVSSVTTTDLTRMKNDIIYSTEEHIVGTWIDGKPIYEKTTIIPDGNNSNKTITTGLNKNNISDIWITDPSFVYEQSTKDYSYPLTGSTSDNTTDWICPRIAFKVNSDEIEIKLRSDSGLRIYSGYFTIQYTKTTD